MEQNNKTPQEELIQKKFKLILEENAQRTANMLAISKSIGDVASALNKYGHELREDTKKRQKDYFSWMNDQLSKLSVHQGLDLLLSERSKLKSKLVIADIEKDGVDRKNIESLLQGVLEPLIDIQKDDIARHKIFIKEFETDEEQEVEKVKSDIETAKSVVSNVVLPEGFKQIECDANKTQILEFFNILAAEINQSYKEPYMTTENVLTLVEKNFKVFGKEPKGGFIKIKLGKQQKGRLRHFMYQFYDKYAAIQSRPKKDYANFLIWNFELFQSENVDVLVNNMGPSKAPKGANRIPVEKYLKS